MTVPDLVVAGVTKLSVIPNDAGKFVASFKLNGLTVYGSEFVVPENSNTVTVTNVVLMEPVVIESEHNPCPDNLDSVTCGEVTFEGATSLTVVLTYQTQKTYYD